jgi:hypothetical protein
MVQTRDWQGMRELSARLLRERTGEGPEVWMRRIQEAQIASEEQLRVWLKERGVTGYAQSILRWERFGYPDFLIATADELVDAQYADRPHLRPIYNAIVQAALALGDVEIQARKTYVSLLTPRRTFARIQATTKSRVDLGLRLEGFEPAGRLRPSKIHESTPLQISFTSPDEVDQEAIAWLERAYDQNR